MTMWPSSNSWTTSRYLYLPRLKNPSVLVAAVRDGLTWEQDAFAYADRFDEASSRYRGLRVSQLVSVPETDPPGLLVKPEVARRQLNAEGPSPDQVRKAEAARPAGGAPVTDSDGGSAPPAVSPKPRRFYGSVVLDPTRVGRDASRIAEEVVASPGSSGY
ncbi:MAG: hypothetical protein IMX01_10005 [Limnochordaceae bacterium]|nr:hypothetical protein [Limnochordaceae bacterium]